MASINQRFSRIVLASLSLLVVGCAVSPGDTTSFWHAENDPSKASLFGGPNRKLKNPSRLHLAYARWQEQVGNLNQARESYEVVLDEEPKSVAAMIGLARIDQLAGRTEEAEAGFQKALKLKPHDPEVLAAGGQFYADQKNWQAAIPLLTQAVASAPNEPEIRYHLAITLARSGDIDTALTHFIKSSGEAEAHYNIALILHEQGKLDASEREFQLALAKRPDFSEASIWLDEIRQEREGTLTPAGDGQAQPSQVVRLAEATTPRSSDDLSAPDPRNARSKPNGSATRAGTNGGAQQSRVQTAGHSIPKGPTTRP